MSITICQKVISDNVDTECSNPIFKGLEQIGYIFNKSDIATITRTGNKITAMTMATGKVGYKIYNAGSAPFNGTNTALAVKTVRNTFDKTLKFVCLNDGVDVSEDLIDGFANGEFVAIVCRKWNNTAGDAKFEVIGAETGAKASAITKDPNDDESMGGWVVELKEEGASTSEILFFATSESGTRSAIEALCTSSQSNG